MHALRGAAFKIEGPPKNGSAAPMAKRDGTDHRKNKKQPSSASTSNRYEPRPASSTGKEPGPRKKRQQQTVDDRFADETPKQQALHREIARRYSWDDRDKPDRRRPNAQLNRRMRELELLFDDRWGPTLPDDDSGRDDFFVAAHQLAQFGDPQQHIPAWARNRAPWLSDTECAASVERVIRKPRKWGAKALGRKMRLTQEERKRLRITTIRAFDVSDDDMRANRATSEKERLRTRRRKAGAVDRAEYEAKSAARNEPWKAVGMTRRTWYRRGKPVSPDVGTGPHAAEYKILLRAQLCHEHSGTVPGAGDIAYVGNDDIGSASELDRIVLGGRAECPAAANTVIDRPTPTKTSFEKKEGDRLCFYKEATGNCPGSVDRGEQ